MTTQNNEAYVLCIYYLDTLSSLSSVDYNLSISNLLDKLDPIYNSIRKKSLMAEKVAKHTFNLFDILI